MNSVLNSHKQIPVSVNLKNNFSFLSSLLSPNDNSIISISSSDNDQSNKNLNMNKTKSQYFPIIKDFLVDCNHPFKALNSYSQLLEIKSINSEVHEDSIFKETFFSNRIHHLLTSYLYEQTCYLSLNSKYEKILDVFYKFLFCEHGQLMEAHLKGTQISNIGKWFYEEGVLKMFKKYFCTSHEFTLFISYFMLYGIAALFVAGTQILKKNNFEPSLQEIELVKIAYIKKYGLE